MLKTAPSNKPKPRIPPKNLGVDTTSDFSLITEYKGYRNKEDLTNLPPGFLVLGSQNVRATTAGRLSIRGGYTLDGQADTSNVAIDSAFDWSTHLGTIRHLRAGNGKLQYRYVATAGDKYLTNTFTEGQVYWIDLMTSLTSTAFNFANFWDFATEKIDLLLMVNGTTNLFDWSGAVTTLASSTANTLTKTGTQTWAELGFLKNGTRKVVINSTAYTYTGGEGTTTLTGVTPDPSAEPANSVVHQEVRTTANASLTAFPSGFNNDLIEVLRNQIYIGSKINNSIYVSKVNDFKDYGFTAPTRVVGEGAILYLDGPTVAMIPQEDTMYISSGHDYWYQTKFNLSADLTGEQLTVSKLKTVSNQGAQSQQLVNKTKNDVMYVSFEPILDTLGRVVNNFNFPQTTNISDPILNEFNSYDFTDGQIFYHRFFIYLSIPRHSIVRIYNIAQGYWEPPQILPVGKFSIIDGDLYGHSYATMETYKLFDGYNDNGQPIDARALFAYENYGTRGNTKYFNEFYVEGYISGNATVNLGIKYEIDGCATDTSYAITGQDSQIVYLLSNDASLGKDSLGKNPLGGDLQADYSTGLPPKFRVIKTFVRNDFYEAQYSFQSFGADYHWEILSFGPLVTRTMYGNNAIKQ